MSDTQDNTDSPSFFSKWMADKLAGLTNTSWAKSLDILLLFALIIGTWKLFWAFVRLLSFLNQ